MSQDQQQNNPVGVAACGCMFVGILAVSGFVMCAQTSTPSNPPPPPAQSGPARSSSITLSDDLIVCFTDAAWGAVGNKDAMMAKIRAGEAGLLTKGTKVTVTGGGFTYKEIVPLDGPFTGRTGKAPVELVK